MSTSDSREMPLCRQRYMYDNDTYLPCHMAATPCKQAITLTARWRPSCPTALCTCNAVICQQQRDTILFLNGAYSWSQQGSGCTCGAQVLNIISKSSYYLLVPEPRRLKQWAVSQMRQTALQAIGQDLLLSSGPLAHIVPQGIYPASNAACL